MLRWQTAGESHGEALVAMIEGMPSGCLLYTSGSGEHPVRGRILRPLIWINIL